jgi:DNA-binding transcriptional MerR regulator
MQKDYSNPDSVREEYEADMHWERARRRHHFLTAFLILLTLALAGVAWYAYPILQRHDMTLSQIPATLTDVQKDLFGLGERAKAADAKLDDWSNRQEELRGQLNKARGDLMARIDSAKKQASEASTALGERIRSEVGTQLDNVKTQLARLETSREGDREQIARLQQELTQVRSQVQQQGQEIASVQGRVDKNAASSEQEIAGVKATQQRDRGDFDAYADKFAVKRLDFEVTKNHSSSVAPGIALQVNATDVSYQKVSGSVLTPDRHTIWLRQLKVQEPVFLTSFADGRTRELVITRVNKTGAVGYVLVPAQETAANRVTRSFTSPAQAE